MPRGRPADGGGGGGATWIEGAVAPPAGAGAGGALGPEDDRPSKLPKMERPTPGLPFITGAGPCPRVEAKGVCLVSLLAFFSRSWNFLMKVLASFSSAKDRPAGQSSSSKVWKNVRSWLYWKLSKISWSQITPFPAGYSTK